MKSSAAPETNCKEGVARGDSLSIASETSRALIFRNLRCGGKFPQQPPPSGKLERFSSFHHTSFKSARDGSSTPSSTSVICRFERLLFWSG
jgi:hypothetical protein